MLHGSVESDFVGSIFDFFVKSIFFQISGIDFFYSFKKKIVLPHSSQFLTSKNIFKSEVNV